MYVVTFYSFKGGVGRTMALMNVAVQLALAGKKILIVDFDLEAPGIPTFALTAPKSDTRGIVEYIVDYRTSGVSPDVRDYVYSAHKFPSGGELTVMPAGFHDGSYSQRLNSIDWHKLYEEEDGYLFFEDLKRQWANSLTPDYVLIDSRTGHSDVEGICTRQLPDSVCLLFFPNEQNLQGLLKVVNNVRAQNEVRRALKTPIALRFAVSNVPDLDDEDGIVGSTLDRFQQSLGYEELSGQIHHYNSLSLLNQEIFSEKRPNSRLAKEYKTLTDAIIRDNLSDRDVATDFLRLAVRNLRSVNARDQISLIVEKVDRVLQFFPTDSEVALDVALIYEAIGRTDDALSLLMGEGGLKSAHHLSIRARLYHRIGNKLEAMSDLRRMLDCDDAQVPSLLDALSLASQLDPTLFKDLPASAVIRSLSDKDRAFVAVEIEGGHDELLAKSTILEELLQNGVETEIIALQLAMASIGLGRFSRAVELLEARTKNAETQSIDDVFNLGMAQWGLQGVPDKELFTTVVKLTTESMMREADPNFVACLAISNFVIGNTDTAMALIGKCKTMMKRRARREFSPWTYTRVSSREFSEHVAELEQQISAGVLMPKFIGAKQNSIV